MVLRLVDGGVGFGVRGWGWLRVGLGVVDGLEIGWHGVRMILLAFPDFCVNKAVKDLVAGDAGESCGGQGGLGVGEMGYAEAGEDAEGEVEEANVEGGERAEDGRGGDGEVR